MALALSGGTNVWYEIQGNTNALLIEGIKNSLRRAGWDFNTTVPSSLTVDFGSTNFINGQGLNIGGQIYTFVTTLSSGASLVKIGATAHDSLVNLKAAVNGEAGAGTLYSAATPLNVSCLVSSVSAGVITFTARIGGPTGNGISTTNGTLYGGGYQVQANSPQGTSVILYIYADASGTRVQMVSTLDATRKSNPKTLTVATNRKFRVVANRCQFFIYVPGIDHLNAGSCAMGGIPWIPSSIACNGEIVTQPVTECWWIMGDGGGISSNSTLRVVFARFGRLQHSGTSSLNGADGDGGSDACFNGVVILGTSSSATVLRVLCLTPGYNINNAASVSGCVSPALWWDDSPLEIEPLVAWADTTSSTFPKIRGQIWDAWIRTDYQPMDQQNTFDGKSWVNFTDRFQYGSLQLLVPGPVQVLVELNAAY